MSDDFLDPEVTRLSGEIAVRTEFTIIARRRRRRPPELWVRKQSEEK